MKTHPNPEQLSAYIDGELTGADRDDLEQHLTSCSDCSATVRALRATLADLRALPSPAPSEQGSWALRAAIAKARKKPAQRYGRWVIAAGSVAAVSIAIAVFSIGGSSPSKKQAGRGTEGPVFGAAPAPAALAPVIQIDPTNYTSKSAKTLLATVVRDTLNGYAALPSAAPHGQGGTTSSTNTRTTANSSDLSTYGGQISQCQSLVLSQNSGGARAIAYVVGRYESTPAFFLIYSVVVSGKNKTEMWVVRQSDCYIRLFVAPQ